jgi:hypothetical protein
LHPILEGFGSALTIASPVNHELDGIHQLQRLVGGIAGKPDYLIVRNEVQSEGFDLFDKSKIRQKLLNDSGAR